MTSCEVIFIGGNPQRHASVRIRAVEIAEALNCRCSLGANWAHDIPEARAFVCVKPLFWPGQLAELGKRGKIIWDVVDNLPPREGVDVYLTSSGFARDLLREYGRTAMIPHRHRNFSGEPNHQGIRRPCWIGSAYWRPALPGLDHDAYFTDHMTAQQVAEAHRRTGIGLNFRKPAASHDIHAALNSGIKLINCIGYGIPSVSADEPAYREFGAHCTIFAELEDCAKWVRELQNNDSLFNDLRQKCIERASLFHINTIAEHYRQFFGTL